VKQAFIVKPPCGRPVAPVHHTGKRLGAGRARQHGQALVLALALLLAGAVALYTLFNSTQFTADKARLTNAADAAAYSAAAWQARVLNYQAYANRAIVANEVQVAQTIALAGWTRFIERLAINFDYVADVIYILKPAAEIVKEIATAVAEVMETVSQVDIELRAAEGYGYKNLLHASQQVMNLAASNAFALNMVTNEVVRATDPRFHAWTLGAAGNMVKTYESVDERRRFANLIVEAAPDFVHRRDGGVSVLGCAVGELKKRGTTVLSEDLDRWESADTASLHGRSGLFGSCKEKIPLGWGGAEAANSQDQLKDEIQTSANGLGDNQRARDLIGSQNSFDDEPSLDQFTSYSGVTAFQDLDFANVGENRKFPTQRTVVLARMAQTNLRTGNTLNLGVGRLRQPENSPRNNLYALAAGEVYFKRPRSSYENPDAPLEYASLFNPYWQARLTTVTDGEREQAMTAGADGPVGGP
jgi:hypothetical protein